MELIMMELCYSIPNFLPSSRNERRNPGRILLNIWVNRWRIHYILEIFWRRTMRLHSKPLPWMITLRAVNRVRFHNHQPCSPGSRIRVKLSRVLNPTSSQLLHPSRSRTIKRKEGRSWVPNRTVV